MGKIGENMFTGRIFYVCDCQKSVKIVMKQDFNPYAIFMTIREFNKLIKLHPSSVSKIDEDTYLKFEGEQYKVRRITRK